MIAARMKRTRPTRLSLALRFAGAATAAAGLIMLGVAGPIGPAQAASSPGYNQITGAGSTESAVTVPWTKGLLNSGNQPLTPAQESTAGDTLATNEDRGAANPTGPLSFMYDNENKSKDASRPATWFKDLQVTVSQTQHVRAQGITVTWTGGGPGTTIHGVTAGADFLQIMECYGDAATGPTADQCEYGAPGLLPQQAVSNPVIAQRAGPICVAGAKPDPANPPANLDGGGAVHGCDPFEPGTSTPSHYAPPCDGTGVGPSPCDNTTFSVPFKSADDSSHPLYNNDVFQDFNQFDSNELQQGLTGVNGRGQAQFETVTSIESQGLGCGEAVDANQVRNCWLVVVPRGEYEPNGFPINTVSAGDNGALNTSPLSAANWAMRIQVHLDYAPDGAFCPLGTTVIQTGGTELVNRAMQSWTLALAQQDKCSYLFNLGPNNEAGLTATMLQPQTSGVGLGFTTIPIGTEGLEDPGGKVTKVPKMLYAPVAVTALGFAFNINNSSDGLVTQSMKLTPMLLAKALTQVYLKDLPDYNPSHGVLPTDKGKTTALQHNPAEIAADPEWVKLNPGIRPLTTSVLTVAPIVVTGKSALNQQVWKWVSSDASTAAWLDGAPDKQYGIVADPDYVSNVPQLGKFPSPSFPRNYQGIDDHTVDLTVPVDAKPPRNSGLLLQEQDSYDTVASDILLGNDPTDGFWDPNAVNGQGGFGNWASIPLQPIGQRFVWGLADTTAMAAFGDIPATLCRGDGPDGAGTGCVPPSEASITAALKAAKADSSGLLHVNPATVPAGAYPLVNVVYAAVPAGDTKDQLRKYAELIKYAVGAGQTPGTAPGNLPPGYLPLPANLASQAKNVAAQLLKMAGPAPTGTPATSSSSPAAPPSTSSVPQGGGGNSPPGITTGATSKPGTSTPSATPGATPSVSLSIEPPTSAQLASGTTPGQNPGSARWAIVAVVIAGLAAAGAGILLRSARLPGFVRRRTRGAGS
jgi:hypothetical protein